jgi:hypothetical protein
MGSSWAEKVLFGCLAENVAGNNDKFLFRVLCLVQSADLSAGESGAGKVTRHADGDFASAHSRTEPVVVCIAGMHRSGTSMVASLIHSCGVYVGPESDIKVSSPDNERGHWEYGDFVQLNDALLEKLGGTWDAPPSPPTNWDGDDLAPLRERAIDLIGRLSSLKRWGWKDPRNSLTLPFWRHLIPRLKVVICLRNPLEVIQSLAKRGSPGDESLLELWQSYNHSLMAAIPAGDRLITHYSAYFPDARHELRRVLDFLGITASNETIERACETVAEELRHHRLGNQGLKEAGVPNDVAMQYLEMCAEAGPVYQQTQRNLTQRD